MVEVRAVGPDDWVIMRDVRLAALRDAPDAFGSTYAREAQFAEAEWRRRASTRNSFLAYLPELGATPAGIAAGIEEEPGAFELVSMWVRPQARGRTVGAGPHRGGHRLGARPRRPGPASVGHGEQQAGPPARTSGPGSRRPANASRCRPIRI